jgi:hypothetical protein
MTKAPASNLGITGDAERQETGLGCAVTDMKNANVTFSVVLYLKLQHLMLCH